jgi:hypothetical protein
MLCVKHTGDLLCGPEQDRGMGTRDIGSVFIGDWLKPAMARHRLTARQIAERIAIARGEDYNINVARQIHALAANLRKAGLKLQREVSKAVGEPIAMTMPPEADSAKVNEARGAIDRNGVFSAPSDITGVGVGSYSVDGLEELGVAPGELAYFLPATPSSVRAGQWYSFRVDGDVRLYLVEADRGALVLRQPRRKALLTYVPDEHVVIGVYVGAFRPAG